MKILSKYRLFAISKQKAAQAIKKYVFDAKRTYDIWTSKYSPSFIMRIKDCIAQTTAQINWFNKYV